LSTRSVYVIRRLIPGAETFNSAAAPAVVPVIVPVIMIARTTSICRNVMLGRLDVVSSLSPRLFLTCSSGLPPVL
jgi:hypothetical protein